MTIEQLRDELERARVRYNEAVAQYNSGVRNAVVKNDLDLYGGRVTDLQRAIEVKQKGLPRPRSLLDFFKYGRTYRRR